MAGLVISTGPTSEPLTLSDVKAYLRVTGSAEDTLITSLIKAARVFCEDFTGRALFTQTLILKLDTENEIDDPLWEGTKVGPYINFYKNFISLPKPPVQTVTSVISFDDADTATTMASSRYYVDSAREPSRVVLRTGETFPTALRVANAIEVTYVAGYAAVADIPEPLKIGMLQHIAYLYDQRGDMKDYQQAMSYPPMVASLYQPYKIMDGLGGSKYMALG
jgi:hypothetical protein